MSEASVDLAARWAELFNSDVDALIDELYDPECTVLGARLGHDRLRAFEQRVLAAAPRRSAAFDAMHASGDVVVVEGVLIDPDQGADWKLPFCAVLTWRDGRIVSDNTYAEFSKWPGAR